MDCGLGPGFFGSGCFARVACRAAVPGGWPLRRPMGLAPCLLLLCTCIFLAQGIFPPLLAPFPRGLGSCLAVTSCAGSQPSSPRSPSSRNPSHLASHRLWAATALTALLFLPQLLHPSRRLRPRPQRHGEGGQVRLLQRLFCGLRELAPVLALLRRCRSGPRGAAPALPPSPLVVPLLLLTRDWSRAWPSKAAHRSHPLSSHVPRGRLRALRTVVPFPAAESDSDSDWDALLDAHGLTPPPVVVATAVAQPAVAAAASRRARDKRRRRLRKAAKRSMWREI